MKFTELESWGYVDPKTFVVDSTGTRYEVGVQNDAGFLRLRNISGGEDLAFEALDRIDHEEFKLG